MIIGPRAFSSPPSQPERLLSRPDRSERLRWMAIVTMGYAVWFLLYQLIGRYAATLPTHDLATRVDRAVPFVPEAVWVYEACYALPFLPVLVVRDRHRLRVALVAALIANAGAFALYLVAPVAFVRPSLGHTLSERALALEYAWEFTPGANNMPSLHVAMSWLVWLICRTSLGSVARASLLGLVIAISASTLLVKQHIVVDVAAGTLWAFASFGLAHAGHGRRA